MPAVVDRLAIELLREFGEGALDEALRRCGDAVDAGDKAGLNRCISVCFALDRKRDVREVWMPVVIAGPAARAD